MKYSDPCLYRFRHAGLHETYAAWSGPIVDLRHRQAEHPRYEQRAGEDQEPALESLRALLQEAHDRRPDESTDVAHRIDERDPAGPDSTGEEHGREAPERPQRAPDAGRRDTQREECGQRVSLHEGAQ